MSFIKKTRLWSVLLLIFTLSNTAYSNSNNTDPTPIKYNLTINTEEKHFKDSPEKLKFNGIVKITFDPIHSGVNGIILNVGNETEVKNVSFNNNRPLDPVPKPENDKLFIPVKNETVNTEFTITVNFTNPFGDDMTGFYRSSYGTGDKKRWLLTTHFEPIFARKAFPCIDQPKKKAKYEINVKVPQKMINKNYFVLSNSICVQNNETNETTVFKCEETPSRMSPYHVAFTVADFAHTESNKNGKAEVTTYGRKDLIDKGLGKLSQEVAPQVLEFLVKYLNSSYTFKKLDQVGVPDFSAGAMENWGHVTYREKSLFFDEEKGTTLSKQSITKTITHELVHQWFGNLVTLESWKYIWLNEAFATYFGYIIADEVKKVEDEKWSYYMQILVSEIHEKAFETDGYPNVKPLTFEVEDEKSIRANFNDITYSKGAAVLRMWSNAIGKESFQAALQTYMKNRKEEGFATPEDLWQAFSTEFEKKNFTKGFFKNWHEQAGYPVVTVGKKNGKYTLKQERFSWSNETDSTVWMFPVTYLIGAEDPKMVMLENKDEVTLENVNISSWILLNYEQEGYYRVNYDKENWKSLSKALNTNDFGRIKELNRAQIINDAFSLARSVQNNYVDYEVVMELSKFLSQENSPIVWKTAFSSFDFLNDKLYKNKKLYEKFKNHVSSLIKFATLKSEKGDSHLKKLLKIDMSRWACSLDHKKCVEEALEIYKEKTYSENPDTMEIVLCTAVRKNSSVWDEVYDMYKQESDSTLKLVYMNALGCSKDPNKINGYLNETLNDNSPIRQQDRGVVLASVYNGHLDNVKLAIEFMKKNYKVIFQKYGTRDPLGKALVDITKKIQHEDDVKTVNELIKLIEETGSPKDNLKTAKNIIQITEMWTEKKLSQIENYLNSGSLFSGSVLLLSLCYALISKI